MLLQRFMIIPRFNTCNSLIMSYVIFSSESGCKQHNQKSKSGNKSHHPKTIDERNEDGTIVKSNPKKRKGQDESKEMGKQSLTSNVSTNKQETCLNEDSHKRQCRHNTQILGKGSSLLVNNKRRAKPRDTYIIIYGEKNSNANMRDSIKAGGDTCFGKSILKNNYPTEQNLHKKSCDRNIQTNLDSDLTNNSNINGYEDGSKLQMITQTFRKPSVRAGVLALDPSKQISYTEIDTIKKVIVPSQSAVHESSFKSFKSKEMHILSSNNAAVSKQSELNYFMALERDKRQLKVVISPEFIIMLEKSKYTHELEDVIDTLHPYLSKQSENLTYKIYCEFILEVRNDFSVKMQLKIEHDIYKVKDKFLGEIEACNDCNTIFEYYRKALYFLFYIGTTGKLKPCYWRLTTYMPELVFYLEYRLITNIALFGETSTFRNAVIDEIDHFFKLIIAYLKFDPKKAYSLDTDLFVQIEETREHILQRMKTENPDSNHYNLYEFAIYHYEFYSVYKIFKDVQNTHITYNYLMFVLAFTFEFDIIKRSDILKKKPRHSFDFITQCSLLRRTSSVKYLDVEMFITLAYVIEYLEKVKELAGINSNRIVYIRPYKHTYIVVYEIPNEHGSTICVMNYFDLLCALRDRIIFLLSYSINTE